MVAFWMILDMLLDQQRKQNSLFIMPGKNKLPAIPLCCPHGSSWKVFKEFGIDHDLVIG